MNEENWKSEFKQWEKLKLYQIKLINDGPKSQSQAWLLNSVWFEWIDLKRINKSEIPLNEISLLNDLWDEV
tara:strand:- start:396 stop:608 length:213 start_codon:yes stop_codon:yes gene_type:complete